MRRDGRTHVVLVDQTDDPNGWTTPVPYNLIELTAAPPSGASTIGNTSDWLRMVFTHEYAHVLHLDQSRGWAALARRVFGRTPFAFPNLTLPLWQIEGIATFEESRGGEGRVSRRRFRTRSCDRRPRAQAPSSRSIVSMAASPIGRRGTGGMRMGRTFMQYLARRFGEEKLAELSGARLVSCRTSASTAFRSVYGAVARQLVA